MTKEFLLLDIFDKRHWYIKIKYAVYSRRHEYGVPGEVMDLYGPW